ncbi:MAG: oligosaccharide flippase family protein [Muribaculaceae bacterium]|nr:oligosaccharide flippase family protein [Muribaculaceae bacterium]
MKEHNTTSKVLKVMSIFTGVEGVGILCSIIKNKLVAIWLSAVGIGLFTIFNQVIDTTSYLTSLGLRQSSVRDISRCRGDESLLKRMIMAVRQWSLLAGLGGGLLLAALSWPLAEVIMGSGKYWWNFVLLGGVMLFNALYAGENAIFQGTENYSRLARTGLETAITGLLVSIPMYRWLGDNSVVYSIITYSVLGCVFAVINRDRRYPYHLSRRLSLNEGREFVRLGAYMSVAAFVSTLLQLIFISWLNVEVSTYEAGLYGAGITLVVRYTGLIFNSVGMEFYPRISAHAESSHRVSVFVNHESVLLLLIFTPLVLVLYMILPLLIRLLYSSDFLPIEPMVSIGILSVLFRSVSVIMSYTLVAKGRGRLYMMTEIADSAIGLILLISLYKVWGLPGIGIGLMATHLIYMLMQLYIYIKVFRLDIGISLVNNIILSVVICVGALFMRLMLPMAIWLPVMLVAVIWYLRQFSRLLRRRGVLGLKRSKGRVMK